MAWCQASTIGTTCLNAASGTPAHIAAKGVKHTLFGARTLLIRSLAVLPDVLAQAEAPSVLPDKLGRPDVLAVYKFPVQLEDAIDNIVRQGHVVARELKAGQASRLDFYHLAIEKS